MDTFPRSFEPTAVSVKSLQNNFLFDLEGHFVVAIRLTSKVAKQISGQEMKTPGGIISKLKARVGLTPRADRWLIVTSVDNPLLEEIWFGAVVADRLTKATGTTVTESELAISASVPVSGVREKDERFDSVGEDQEQLVAQQLTR